MEGVGSKKGCWFFLRPKRKCLEHACVVPGSLNWPMSWSTAYGPHEPRGPLGPSVDVKTPSKTSGRSGGSVLL